MYTCAICGKIKATKREIHGHLMFAHRDEYIAAGYNNDKLIIYNRDPDQTAKPAGFRYLKNTDPAEAKAIAFGYMFIDSDGELYTESDSRKRGWI